MILRKPSARCAAVLPRSTGLCNPKTLASKRSYHARDHPTLPSPFTRVESTLLSSAYKHVPSHGFTQKALYLGANDAGFSDISPSVLHHGPFSLIRYHLFTQRSALLTRSRQVFGKGEGEPQDKGTREKVAILTWERLLANRPVIHHWQEALAIMAQMTHAPLSLKELGLLSDEIWFLAGDSSVDPSWYTKRASLSIAYSTSELFMTSDESANFTETEQFLHRRLNEMQTVGGLAWSVGQWTGFTANAAVNVLRSKGVPI